MKKIFIILAIVLTACSNSQNEMEIKPAKSSYDIITWKSSTIVITKLNYCDEDSIVKTKIDFKHTFCILNRGDNNLYIKDFLGNIFELHNDSLYKITFEIPQDIVFPNDSIEIVFNSFTNDTIEKTQRKVPDIYREACKMLDGVQFFKIKNNHILNVNRTNNFKVDYESNLYY